MNGHPGSGVLVRATLILAVWSAALFGDAAVAFQSDDFNRSNLDPARWTFVNPLGDGWVEMTHAGTDSARVNLSVPTGVSHDPWQINRSVRIMQPVSDADLAIEVKLESEPSQRYQMQGLIFEQDEDDWIRIETQHDGSSLKVFAAVTEAGTSSSRLTQTVTTGGARFMRISRTGSDWLVETSSDGSTYDPAGSFTHPLNLSAAGLFVANHTGAGGISPEYTAVFDYAFETSSPITPEDGTPAPDTWPPFNHNVAEFSTGSDLIISWNTDEPAEGAVSYGTTEAYELGTISETGLSTMHFLTLPGLVPGNTYHYQICSEDVLLQGACEDDQISIFDPNGPDIDVWYGLTQPFGALGQPQPWANLLGKVSDPDGVSSLSYTLNGGTPVALSIGPDNRRLENAGDFNVDLATSALSPGTNTVVITAVDSGGNESIATVTATYTDGTVWPFPYTADWSTLSIDDEIQDVAQVVDGRWGLDGGLIRTLEPGYDRLVAVGDSTWTDYEFLVPFTLNDAPGGYGTGVLVRWNGHTDVPVVCGQPKCGYLPLGAIFWVRSGRFEIFGNDGDIYDSTPFGAVPGLTYWMRGRVETLTNGSLYSAKLWEDGLSEPTEWDVIGQSGVDDPLQGSLMLISHQADASFGALTVTELETPNLPPTAADDFIAVAPLSSVEIDVLANDFDIDGSLDSTSVLVALGPQHGSAGADSVSGTILYQHDGSPSIADSIQYTVLDNEGEVSNTATVHISISQDPPAAAISDDFNRCVLDSFWSFVDPLADGGVSLVGAGTGDAYLELSLPAGTDHNAWGPGGLNETIRVMQPAQNLDFQIEAKWNAEPAAGFNDQGLIVEEDPDNWLRFDVFHDNSELRLFVGKTINGSNSILFNAAIASGSASHLRVTRVGNLWTTATSIDGSAWVDQHSFTETLEVSEIGIFAGNPTDALAFVSEVDYFLVQLDPFPAEDGALLSVSTTTAGQGTVQADPNQPAYECNDVVTMTAVPEPGWAFVSWSGDLSGSSNPAPLTITGPMSVTATFDLVSSVDDATADPSRGLLTAHPNPFSISTTFHLRLPTPEWVRLDIVDVAGRLVRRILDGERLPAGASEIRWDGSIKNGQPAATGVYFARLSLGTHLVSTRVLRIE